MESGLSSFIIACFVLGSAGLVALLLIICIYIDKNRNSKFLVYLKDENGNLKDSLLANRFCLMVVTNSIKAQILSRKDTIFFWRAVRDILEDANENEIYSIDSIHDLIKEKYRYDNIITRELVNELLDKIKEDVYYNLRQSALSTPPFFYAVSYVKWIRLSLNK